MITKAILAAGLLAACAAPQPDRAASEPEPARLGLDPHAPIELEATWEPCRESKYGLFAETEALRRPEPAERRRAYGVESFAPLLPEHPVAVGDAWRLDPRAILPFLRQLHPGARAELHHGFGSAPGAHACLRALGAGRAEILLRAHAELDLGGGITYTPAQFEGRLVLDTRRRAVSSFRLALPDRNTNVDVNVPSESSLRPGGPAERIVAADIGWVPRMELRGGYEEPVAWERGLPDAAARALLARRFYAFAAIPWRPFDQAVQRARELRRPLHVVVLFGALDDESC